MPFKGCCCRSGATRSEATASILEDRMAVNIAAGDIDQLAATLQHKITHGRLYLTCNPT